jgi:molybdopterin/thiamine biosynthesis adenylyltransferase
MTASQQKKYIEVKMDTQLENDIYQKSVDGFISLDMQMELSKAHKISMFHLEETMLKLGITPKRYIKNKNTVSSEKQLKLLQSAVVIIGCGGLGGHVSSQLARLGVGKLILVDPDVYDETNLNRQCFSNISYQGKSKVGIIKKLLKKINPAVKVVGIKERFSEQNFNFLESADVVADCLDSINTRKILSKVCSDLRIPLVHASIGGFYGQSAICMPGDNIIEKIYGCVVEDKGIEVIAGNLSFVAAIFASIQTMLIYKVLTDDKVKSKIIAVSLNEFEVSNFFDL